MSLPSVEDVNATRLTRFDDAITAALEDADRIARFRDIITHYVTHHDVPEGDVAAALALVAQGDTPLLLDAEADEPPRRDRFDRDDRGRGDRGDRGSDRDSGRGDRGDRGSDRGDRGSDRGDRRRSSGPTATYRIEVGRRHKVEPRQIVGALANEGGLRREDFGAIQIRPDFSLVELPADLPRDTLKRLEGTRISGRLIEIKPDRFQRSAKRPDRGDRGDLPRRRYDD